jgi:hypothetical protein
MKTAAALPRPGSGTLRGTPIWRTGATIGIVLAQERRIVPCLRRSPDRSRGGTTDWTRRRRRFGVGSSCCASCARTCVWGYPGTVRTMSAGKDDSSWFADRIGTRHTRTFMVAVAGGLALGAAVGVAWTAGFEPVWRQLLHPHWFWLLVALAGEAFAYVGYTLAYREVARAEQGAS